MKMMALFLLLCSHVPLAWPCFRRLKVHILPRSIDLVGVSFLLFFDMEIAFEAFGGSYSDPFFKSVFSGNSAGLTIGLLLIAPWAIKLGYLMIVDLAPFQRPQVALRIQHSRIFYPLSLVLCAGILGLALFVMANAVSFYGTKDFIKDSLGVLAVVFYVPSGILSFYVWQPESRTKWGRIFTFALAFVAVVAQMPGGERIPMLTPILILFVFYGKPSLTKFVGISSALIAAAVLLMGLLKYKPEDNKTAGDLAYLVFAGDFSRGPALAASLDNSVPMGSSLLPYPGSAYVYTALFYIPRSVLPSKGLATPAFLTARIMNQRAEDLDWGFGNSAIDDLALNFGWLTVPLGMFVYGSAFALLDMASLRVPALKIASLLSAIWIMGYSLPVLINVFGTVSLIGGLCQLFFTRRSVSTGARVVDLTPAQRVRTS